MPVVWQRGWAPSAQPTIPRVGSHPITYRLAAAWHFGIGGLRDLVSGLNLTTENGATFGIAPGSTLTGLRTGLITNAASANATVTLPSAKQFTSLPVTMVWFGTSITGPSNGATIWGICHDSAGAAPGYYLWASGAIANYAWQCNTTTGTLGQIAGTEHMIVYRFAPDFGDMWINGVRISSTGALSGAAIGTNPRIMFGDDFGVGSAASIHYQALYYNRLLSAAEIQALWLDPHLWLQGAQGWHRTVNHLGEVAPEFGDSFGPLVWYEWEGSDGTTRVWGPVDLPDASNYYHGYKSPKVLNAGRVVRALSDEQGEYQGQTFDVTIHDTDRDLRTLLGQSDARRHFLNSRIVARMISQADWRLKKTPRTVAIGQVRNYKLH